MRQVTFTPASGNIYQHYLNEYKAKPVIHNKDWRFKRFAVELPPSSRVTKVVNHKPRIGKPSVAFTWDRVKN
ncbi:hypothetical protein AWF62_20130 [Escherichia coli]|nr:hypothetical protein [Escherichia coli]KUR35323.1 hypothetical protein AWF57_09060 [Escherichia coli]KUR96414.1 hypothetical protein AWE54_05755 [Escherichia coli]KUS04325.1 hypothetical protein AWE52_15415 [Escherichia coli]KUW28424.1 hypothetical protein AWF62_20130 [Escherichia coli]